MVMQMSELLDLIATITKVDAEPEILDALAVAASERAKTIRLKREQEYLRRRIAEEDARLSRA